MSTVVVLPSPTSPVSTSDVVLEVYRVMDRLLPRVPADDPDRSRLEAPHARAASRLPLPRPMTKRKARG